MVSNDVSRWIRWSGLLAIVSGALFTASLVSRYYLFQSYAVRDGMRFPFMVLHIIVLVASIGILLALVGFYAYQAREAGRLGLAGFLAAFVGWTMVTGVFWFGAFGVPTIARHEPKSSILTKAPYAGAELFSFVLAGVGLLLFALAAYRARMFPRWAILALVVGDVMWGVWSALDPFGFPVGQVGLSIGIGAMALTLWFSGHERAPDVVPAAHEYAT